MNGTVFAFRHLPLLCAQGQLYFTNVEVEEDEHNGELRNFYCLTYFVLPLLRTRSFGLFQFTILYVLSASSKGGRLTAGPVNCRRQWSRRKTRVWTACMTRMGFELTVPAFEWFRTTRLDRVKY